MTRHSQVFGCRDIVLPVIDEQTLVGSPAKAVERQFEYRPVRLDQLFLSGNYDIHKGFKYRRCRAELSPGFGTKIADRE